MALTPTERYEIVKAVPCRTCGAIRGIECHAVADGYRSAPLKQPHVSRVDDYGRRLTARAT